MYELNYDESTGYIHLVNDNGVKSLLEPNFSSVPSISPDGTKAVYITPLEWEADSNLILFDLESGERTVLSLELEKGKEKAKDVTWIDDNRLALIIGLTHGTVAVGGNIYIYDLRYHQIIPMTNYDDYRKQAIKLSVVDDSLLVDAIEYIDNNLNRFEKKQERLPLSNFA